MPSAHIWHIHPDTHTFPHIHSRPLVTLVSTHHTLIYSVCIAAWLAVSRCRTCARTHTLDAGQPIGECRANYAAASWMADGLVSFDKCVSKPSVNDSQPSFCTAFCVQLENTNLDCGVSLVGSVCCVVFFCLVKRKLAYYTTPVQPRFLFYFYFKVLTICALWLCVFCYRFRKNN